jgi:hypothetical protein
MVVLEMPIGMISLYLTTAVIKKITAGMVLLKSSM